MNDVNGVVNGVKYSIDPKIVERLKNSHNIDAIKEIEDALKKVNQNENKSTQG